MKRITAILTIGLAIAGGQAVFGQGVSDVRRMYDSGQYQQVIAAASGNPDPRLTFLRAQSYQKLSQINEARDAYTQLSSRPGAWGDIGRSALGLLATNSAAAIEAATQGVAHDPALPEAYYTQGLAFSANQDFSNAATAFQKASDLDPNWAYAHYYAGLAYSKVKRIDLTAQHFQAFLRLAPQAPERAEVQSIMRTLNR
jgi:tetratricopeptide (TPR) repeat protein